MCVGRCVGVYVCQTNLRISQITETKVSANLSILNSICKMKITALQSVHIFGWWNQPRITLAWEDVKDLKLSWAALRRLGFDPVDLKHIQPDNHEWIKRGSLAFTDIKDMTVFPVNPLKDFHADLAELWNMACTCDDLLVMNVTFDDLLNAGLNPQIMAYFNMRLSEWVSLGMSVNHIKHISDAECLSIFGLDREEVVSITNTFSKSSHGTSSNSPTETHSMST